MDQIEKAGAAFFLIMLALGFSNLLFFGDIEDRRVVEIADDPSISLRNTPQSIPANTRVTIGSLEGEITEPVNLNSPINESDSTVNLAEITVKLGEPAEEPVQIESDNTGEQKIYFPAKDELKNLLSQSNDDWLGEEFLNDLLSKEGNPESRFFVEPSTIRIIKEGGSGVSQIAVRELFLARRNAIFAGGQPQQIEPLLFLMFKPKTDSVAIRNELKKVFSKNEDLQSPEFQTVADSFENVAAIIQEDNPDSVTATNLQPIDDSSTVDIVVQSMEIGLPSSIEKLRSAPKIYCRPKVTIDESSYSDRIVINFVKSEDGPNRSMNAMAGSFLGEIGSCLAEEGDFCEILVPSEIPDYSSISVIYGHAIDDTIKLPGSPGFEVVVDLCAEVR